MVGQGRSRCPRRPAFRVGRRGKATAALLGVLLVVVAGFEGSYALWKATVPMGGGQVQAADFRVEMKNLNGTSVNMPDGVNLSEGQDQKPLSPGDSMFHEVTVWNRGTARGEAAKVYFSLRNPPSVTPPNLLDVAVARTLWQGKCTEVAASDYRSSPQKHLLDKNNVIKLCFRLTLKHDAPSSAQGRSVKVTVPLQADQVPPT